MKYSVEDTSLALVLIETLWNVKMSSCKLSSGYSIVLIETLWNVKKTDIAQIQLFGALY